MGKALGEPLSTTNVGCESMEAPGLGAFPGPDWVCPAGCCALSLHPTLDAGARYLGNLTF